MWFLHLETAMQNPSYRLSFVVGFTPFRNPYSATRIFPLRVSSSHFCWCVKTPLGSECESNSTIGISPHLEVKSLGVPLMGLPTLENAACLPNHSQDRPTIPVIKINTPKRGDHSDFKKPTTKQAGQDPYNHFHFKEIHVFYSKKSFHSEYIPLNTYLITSNKSNTEFNYTPAFIFFEKKYIWSRYGPFILPLRPATPPYSEDTSSQECPPKGTTSLLTPLSRDPRRSSGRFLQKNKKFLQVKGLLLFLGTRL